MTTGGKYKLFKICKELNLGHETIIGFLEQKKIKVDGPNSSVSEELYFEIIERFASEKVKAEQLKARKEKTTSTSEAEESKPEQPAESSAYLEALKESIKFGVEAINKAKDEKVIKKPVVKRPKIQKEKEIIPAEPSAEDIIPVKLKIEAEPKEKSVSAETHIKEEPKTVIPPVPHAAESGAVKMAELPHTVPAIKHPVAHKPTEIPKPKPLSEEEEKHAGAVRKLKPLPEKKPETEEDRHLTDKDRKRRKAMEMIRKEKDTKRGGKMSSAEIEEELESVARRRKGRRPKKKQVDLKEVQDTLKKTLASIDSKGRKPKRHKKIKTVDGDEIEEKIIKVTEFISVNDLANLMDVPVSEIITKCLELGLIVSINQRLDIDTISLLAEEYGYKLEEQYTSDFMEEEEEDEEEDESRLKPRAPIVTIMGHVDHGKTSLLDYLRKSNIVSGEAGGITQHIGAYEVVYEGRKITFLDTPGHEAFTAMRARGAQVTDIVILVIAADDAVMPQTDEALDHARAAGVKIVIAINKIDKPGANSERIRQQLAERDVLVEDWGGTYQCAEISAKSGKGVPELLEKILLEAEMLDLKADDDCRATGVVIEARLDKGKGAIATVLVEKGTLKIGDNFIAGHNFGKVRALLNERDERIKTVNPSQPALVVGFMGVPQAGDRYIVVKDERTAREISTKRQQLKREQDAKQVKMMTLQQISDRIKHGEVRDLPVLVKADVDGSAEALADSLIKLNTSEVKLNIIRKAVGPISESDVLLASASKAVIIGFHVRPNVKARELAEKENVDIRLYRIIYDAINDIKLAMEGMLAPSLQENVVGQAEVRDTFKISRLGVIAGCYVLSGKIMRNHRIRLVRDDVEVYSGTISSLKRFKDDTREVLTGFECGIMIENYNDIKVGDIIESYEVSEVKRTLV